MKKLMKVLGIAAVYAGIATLVILAMLYFYQSSDFFRSLFEGRTVQPVSDPSAVNAANAAASTLAQTTAKLSFFILIFVMLLQIFAFVTALLVYQNLRASKESYPVRLKKLENADLFLDLPLYFGLFGTVSAFIVMSFNPQISRLIAYSSTLVGIIFSVILRLTLQYPLKQKLIGEMDHQNAGEKTP